MQYCNFAKVFLIKKFFAEAVMLFFWFVWEILVRKVIGVISRTTSINSCHFREVDVLHEITLVLYGLYAINS